jgi:putative ABC transport system substrate-binding protein
LVALAPSVIMAAGTLGVSALQRHGNAIPIVFVNVADPVGAGFVNNLAHPGGNVTGFMNFEYSMGGKWLELLKQIVPASPSLRRTTWSSWWTLDKSRRE